MSKKYLSNPLANKLLLEVYNELKNIIPINKDRFFNYVKIGHAKTSLGQCKKHAILPYYTIILSKYLLNCDLQLIKNTIAHELIHTCEGCFNHGALFKAYASMVNNKLNNYNIVVKNQDIQFRNNVKKSGYKYKLTCTCCGHVFYRNRLCGHNLIHTSDNGKLKIEKLK